MAAKITQEEAIEKMKSVHDGFYTYELVSYTGATAKITVSCPDHGPFQTTFSNHTHKSGPRGCPTCGDISRAKKKTKPVETFLARAVEIHGDKYDYSKVVYRNTHTKVEIVCKAHDSFWQSPEKHIAKRGCPICAGRGTQGSDRFRTAAAKVHGDKYDYSLVTDEDFKSVGAKVPIICRVHDVFHQNYSNHLQGQGCAKCAKYGFSTAKPGVLYVMTDGDRAKVGITNRDIKIRLKEINKPSGNFDILKTYDYELGTICLNHETETLKFLRANYENTQGTFDGVTESFEGVDAISVIAFIEELRKYGEEEKTRASI